MAVAGAVVVPISREVEHLVRDKLGLIKEVEVQGIGENGIAVILEAENPDKLQKISEEINKWEEVIDFQLAYLNWEDKSSS